MRLHVIALPHTQTTSAFPACAFNQKVVKLCKMFARDHQVYLYAGEYNEAPCAEHIVCLSEADRARYVTGHYTAASFDAYLPIWREFNGKAIEGLHARLQPQDIICLIGGTSQQSIAEAFPAHIVTEFGIGYPGSFAKYRVFESYAWMHMTYGAEARPNIGAANGGWYDAVIPNQIDPEQFSLRAKEDYYLFVGRITERKGYQIAQEVCEKLKVPLILAGPGEGTGYGKFVGEVGYYERNRLMSGARALFAPTLYVEPFGSVAIEAMAAGTPVISTDWGAFTETVIPGLTGYRCRTFEEFLTAAEQVKFLSPAEIREHATLRYALASVKPQYETYFSRLLDLWSEGWYSCAA